MEIGAKNYVFRGLRRQRISDQVYETWVSALITPHPQTRVHSRFAQGYPEQRKVGRFTAASRWRGEATCPLVTANLDADPLINW
jgi:hypothetical protein